MATLTQFLNQYKWGVVGVVGAAVVGGLIWSTNRPTVVPVAETVAEIVAPAEQVVAPVAEVAEAAPVVEIAEEPAAQETAPIEEAAAEPVSEVATEPVVEAVVEPQVAAAVEPQVEAVAEAANQAALEQAAEPATEAASEVAVVPVAETVAEPVAEVASEVAIEPVAETVAEPVAEVAAVATEPATAPAVETSVATEAVAAETPDVNVEVAASAAATEQAPSLDLVRVEPGGSAVIAGTAAPNSEVAIKIDGETVATTTASAEGEFVAFVETGDEAGTQAIQAVSEDEVGVDLVSADVVLVLTPPALEGEVAAPAVVSATEESIKVLQPGGLAVPDQVSLDSISYDKAGEAILAGRAQPLREVRIYVDDVFAVSGQTTDSGAWEIKLDQVAAGRYILRVDEIGPDGAVTSRAQTPFQKEYPENIAPFLQMANGKLTVQPGNTLWVMAREIYGSGIQYTQIFAANRDSIGDPDLIFPGQIFDIPKN